jgi:telomere length regulation protein
MEEFLVPAQTKRTGVVPLIQPISESSIARTAKLVDSKDVAEILKNQPDLQSLKSAVEYLHDSKEFSVRIPSPRTTPIIQALIYDVLPNYWAQLVEDKSLKKLLEAVIELMTSLPALAAIVTRLRILSSASGADAKPGKSEFLESQSICLIQLSERICSGNSLVRDVWADISAHGGTDMQIQLLWKEFVALLSSGKIVSSISEAESNLNKSSTYSDKSWLANGSEYSSWLARNIEFLSRQETSNTVECSAMLLAKSSSLGYTGTCKFGFLLGSLFTMQRYSGQCMGACYSCRQQERGVSNG